MTRTVVLAALVGALAGFAVGWAASRTSEEPRPAAAPSTDGRDDVAKELKRLAAKIEGLDASVRSMKDRTASEPPGRESRPAPAQGATAPASPAPVEPSGDPYVSWTDDEIALVALSKGDDLNLFKAALRRPLASERRAKVLLAASRYYHKLEWHGPAEREALLEAVRLAPASTAVGAEAALALAYNWSAYPAERWRSAGLFEAVLRDAPGEDQKMKGAYGLAWRRDLGDEPADVALDAYRKFLTEYGEKWESTPEVGWANNRVIALSVKR